MEVLNYQITLKRTELTYEILKDIDSERTSLSDEVVEEVEIMVKYEGYIKMQEAQVESFKKLEKKNFCQKILIIMNIKRVFV